jgi:hypothetical protein
VLIWIVASVRIVASAAFAFSAGRIPAPQTEEEQRAADEQIVDRLRCRPFIGFQLRLRTQFIGGSAECPQDWCCSTAAQPADRAAAMSAMVAGPERFAPSC